MDKILANLEATLADFQVVRRLDGIPRSLASLSEAQISRHVALTVLM